MNRIYFDEYQSDRLLKVYTIRFGGEDENETNKFIEKHLELGYIEDIQIIKAWLKNLSKRGARESYFRFEKNAYAGPILTSKLRIYCIRCHDNMIILDGGGVKEGRTAQDGNDTKEAFNLMNAIDKLFREKLRSGEIKYGAGEMELLGELHVELEDYE